MPPSLPETAFLLVRHARTQWNVDRRIQGQQDTPLTPEGIRQAEAWGRQLKGFGIGHILTSDLGRAVKTARLINGTLNVSIEKDPRLREQHWGEWTGLTMAHVRSLHPDVLEMEKAAPWAFQPPGGEDRLSIVSRACRSLEETAGRRPGASVLVVCHEGIIKGLIHFLATRRSPGQRVSRIRPYHLHVLTGTPESLKVTTVNRLGLETGK